ncbi:Type 1 glutamine amidotransferase (GATase1) [Mariniphaga anaerophila]|uniref:Type 1 glutamine amidotransferase (GATase1) n=1 Tax=Mariniphaga anaerophila TaxID=1484053 RepID=A0A1M4UD61_9BACT|nr:Type 1 glutamine amidotransferase (GATase1) [Mariniphaga anaerophila]
MAPGCSSGGSGDKLIKVLILSGSNNHDWEKTTPFLEKILTGSGLFSVEVTEKPDTLTLSGLVNTDVIVSNWNSWPDNGLRWPEPAEKALLHFIQSGGGFVTFHASTSAFYNWPEFKEISTASWIMDSTWHGKRGGTRVTVENNRHPVTRGMSGFFIYDELWVNARENENFEVLGSATNEGITARGIKNQPAVFAAGYGKGKIFNTILGHDVRAMQNTGFKTLILRGTEWAATGKVTQTLPHEFQENRNTAQRLSWQRTDTTFALLNGKNLLWQYNFNTIYGRPFFHPVYAGNNNITCHSPDDHPWHLGQWFCWKYINRVNYWEYLNRPYDSDGITEIKSIEIIPRPDFSAEIKLKIVYHPTGGENVLSEFRRIQVSPPQGNGDIFMDYQFDFDAIDDTVILDRTPIEEEPGGKSWGGYAGLSIRFNQDFMKPHFISSWNDNEKHQRSHRKLALYGI